MQYAPNGRAALQVNQASGHFGKNWDLPENKAAWQDWNWNRNMQSQNVPWNDGICSAAEVNAHADEYWELYADILRSQ